MLTSSWTAQMNRQERRAAGRKSQAGEPVSPPALYEAGMRHLRAARLLSPTRKRMFRQNTGFVVRAAMAALEPVSTQRPLFQARIRQVLNHVHAAPSHSFRRINRCYY